MKVIINSLDGAKRIYNNVKTGKITLSENKDIQFSLENADVIIINERNVAIIELKGTSTLR